MRVKLFLLLDLQALEKPLINILSTYLNQIKLMIVLYILTIRHIKPKTNLSKFRNENRIYISVS